MISTPGTIGLWVKDLPAKNIIQFSVNYLYMEREIKIEEKQKMN